MKVEDEFVGIKFVLIGSVVEQERPGGPKNFDETGERTICRG